MSHCFLVDGKRSHLMTQWNSFKFLQIHKPQSFIRSKGPPWTFPLPTDVADAWLWTRILHAECLVIHKPGMARRVCVGSLNDVCTPFLLQLSSWKSFLYKKVYRMWNLGTWLFGKSTYCQSSNFKPLIAFDCLWLPLIAFDCLWLPLWHFVTFWLAMWPAMHKMHTLTVSKSSTSCLHHDGLRSSWHWILSEVEGAMMRKTQHVRPSEE